MSCRVLPTEVSHENADVLEPDQRKNDTAIRLLKATFLFREVVL